MAKTFNKREIFRFCSQLQLLITSGVPLLDALSMIARLTKNPVYNNMAEKLSEGESLARAMSAYFPPVISGSIESAEKAGNLEEVLGRLSAYYKSQVEIEEKIKSAMLYPCLVIILCFFSLLILILFVVPDFKSMFKELGISLPLITTIFMALAEYLAGSWLILISLSLVFIFILKKVLQTERGGACLDHLQMKIRFFYEEQVLQVLRSLGYLLQGGIPLNLALALTVQSIKNRVLKRAMVNLKNEVENGAELNQALSQAPCFSSQIINMVALGEKSGRLSEMLLSATDFYEMEREIFVKRLITLFEPGLTLVVGLLVAVVALAMFLPMINMLSGLQ